jgi:hypothetical protein
MAQEPASFDDELERLADDARRAEARRARLQRSDRAIAAGLSATLVGTLTELCETQSPVLVMTRSGDHIRGAIEMLGPDVVVLHGGRAIRVLVRLSAIEGIREPGVGHDRELDSISTGKTLGDHLDEMSVENQRLAITLASGNRAMGSVRRVGIDQVTLHLHGEDDSLTIPLAAIDQVVVDR